MAENLNSNMDYSAGIRYQYRELEKNKKEIDSLFRTGRWLAKISTPRLLNRFNGILAAQLLSAKETLAGLIRNIDAVQDKDLSRQLEDLDNWLNLIISFQHKIDQLAREGGNRKHPALTKTESLLVTIIENLYAIRRIFIKANWQPSKETSALAKSLSNISASSLQKALYGR